MRFSWDNHHSTNQLAAMNKFILLITIASALALPQGKKKIQENYYLPTLLKHTFIDSRS